MISYIKGELVTLLEDKVILDVNGMGYGIFMPGSMMSTLPQVGSVVKLHTYLNVREDAMQLFGFMTPDDLTVFKLVIGVNGIGPKGGLGILSVLSPNDLRFAVASGDVKAISSAPGIGKKTAEKLIIELKDKLHLEDALAKGTEDDLISIGKVHNREADEAVQALVALGYDMSASLKAVRQVENPDGTLGTEEILKVALKFIM